VSSDRIRLRLQPLNGGSFTQLSATGPIATAMPPRELKQILASLGLWSGTAVDIVLDADAPASWLEFWTGALSQIPERLFRVRFHLARRAGGHRDER
jgi:hypothetical protein